GGAEQHAGQPRDQHHRAGAAVADESGGAGCDPVLRAGGAQQQRQRYHHGHVMTEFSEVETRTLDAFITKLAASAKSKSTATPVDPRLVEALVAGISAGHGPVIKEQIAKSIFAALAPLKAQLEDIEARLVELEQRR